MNTAHLPRSDSFSFPSSVTSVWYNRAQPCRDPSVLPWPLPPPSGIILNKTSCPVLCKMRGCLCVYVVSKTPSGSETLLPCRFYSLICVTVVRWRKTLSLNRILNITMMSYCFGGGRWMTWWLTLEQNRFELHVHLRVNFFSLNRLENFLEMCNNLKKNHRWTIT